MVVHVVIKMLMKSYHIYFWIFSIIIFNSCVNHTSELTFNEHILSLGEVKIRDSLQVSFTYINDSREDIFIKSIQSSCDCIIDFSHDTIIRKGSQGSINAYYIPIELGKFEKNIVLRTTTDKEFYSLNFGGIVIE